MSGFFNEFGMRLTELLNHVHLTLVERLSFKQAHQPETLQVAMMNVATATNIGETDPRPLRSIFCAYAPEPS